MTTQLRFNPNQLVLDFFDPEASLLEQYNLYTQALNAGMRELAGSMREIIQEEVGQCPDWRPWWRSVLEEERFSDFSSSSSGPDR